MLTPQMIARINRSKLTDEDRDQAIEATSAFLVKIDVKKIEQLRRRFELPPETFGFLVEIYASLLVGAGDRELLPLSSKGPVLPGATTVVQGEVKRSFRAERLFIASAGTDGGTADWIVNDVKVDGKTQFAQPGDVPGDMFASGAIDSFVSFAACREKFELIVTYIGSNPEGVHFYAAAIGSADLKDED